MRAGQAAAIARAAAVAEAAAAAAAGIDPSDEQLRLGRGGPGGAYSSYAVVPAAAATQPRPVQHVSVLRGAVCAVCVNTVPMGGIFILELDALHFSRMRPYNSHSLIPILHGFSTCSPPLPPAFFPAQIHPGRRTRGDLSPVLPHRAPLRHAAPPDGHHQAVEAVRGRADARRLPARAADGLRRPRHAPRRADDGAAAQLGEVRRSG